ncbi:MAG: hypothetical protein HKM04_10285, partial [Legionellales bacterium]|nr:hypothetical protein [Legionellales bacterium]
MSQQNSNELPLDQNEQIALRRGKLVAMREQGAAFPNDFRRDSLAMPLLN